MVAAFLFCLCTKMYKRTAGLRNAITGFSLTLRGDVLMKTDKSQKNKSPKLKRKSEKLSVKDIEELMGIHIDTYRRKNGAIRRK
jgi:hypothetical protein